MNETVESAQSVDTAAELDDCTLIYN